MNKEENVNQNSKFEMLQTVQNTAIQEQEERAMDRFKSKQRYMMALHCLKKINEAEENGSRKNWEIKRRKYQAVVDKYLVEHANSPQNEQLDRQPIERKSEANSSLIRPLSEVIKDPLCLVIVCERRGYDEPISSEWPGIESDFMELVKAYNLTNKNGPIPRYDTREIHRGFRIIKCIDEFSKEFINDCFEKICNKWMDLNLKLISADKLPKKQKKPKDLRKTNDLKNVLNSPNNSETFNKNNKPPTPPAPSWPDELKGNNRPEIVNEIKVISSECFRRSTAITHIGPTQTIKNVKDRQFLMQTPQTSSRIPSQYNKDYMHNTPKNIGLSKIYDITDKKSILYKHHRQLQRNSLRNPNFQQKYPQTPVQCSYKNSRYPKYLNPGREINFTKRSESEWNKTYSEGWQNFPDYYGSSGTNLQETYQNSQQNCRYTYTNPVHSFYTPNQNLNICTALPSAEVNFKKLPQDPSNLPSNYGPQNRDTTLSMDSLTTFEHQSSDDDEVPPPPPNMKNFNDCEDDMKRSRRRRSYWN